MSSSFVGNFAPDEVFTTDVVTYEPDNPQLLKNATSIAWDLLIDNSSIYTGTISDFTTVTTGVYKLSFTLNSTTYPSIANGTHLMARFTVVVPDSGAVDRTSVVTHHANIQPDLTELLTGAAIQNLLYDYTIDGVAFKVLLARWASAFLGENSGPDVGVAGTFTGKAVGAPGTTRITATVDAQGYRSSMVFNDPA